MKDNGMKKMGCWHVCPNNDLNPFQAIAKHDSDFGEFAFSHLNPTTPKEIIIRLPLNFGLHVEC